MRRALRNAAFVAATFVVQAAGQTPAPDSSTRPTLDRPLRIEIAMLSRLLGDVRVPPADQFILGSHEVTDSQPARGTVAVARGNLGVRGPVQGDALVLHGDLLVYPGGLISGNAVAVDGRVRIMGGVVGGDVRSVRAERHASGEQRSDREAAVFLSLRVRSPRIVLGLRPDARMSRR